MRFIIDIVILIIGMFFGYVIKTYANVNNQIHHSKLNNEIYIKSEDDYLPQETTDYF